MSGQTIQSKDVFEQEANYFAMHLLVPDRLLIKEKPIDLTDDDQVIKMAKRYKVSIGVLVFRLGEFYASQSA